MSKIILIIFSTALISNVVLTQFLGLCSFFGVSKHVKTAFSMGLAVIFTITLASAVASLLYSLVLEPLGLEYLRTIIFILIIAALVQVMEMEMKKNVPALYRALGIYLPLITTNCAVLGVALNNVTDGFNFIESVASGFGTAVGYTIAIVALAGVRERIYQDEIPRPFRGAPVVMIAAALMAIAFAGFNGLTIG